jgi:hypothetical protein
MQKYADLSAYPGTTHGQKAVLGGDIAFLHGLDPNRTPLDEPQIKELNAFAFGLGLRGTFEGRDRLPAADFRGF